MTKFRIKLPVVGNNNREFLFYFVTELPIIADRED